MAKVEVRFSGFGGQGIILAGYISGKAATLFDKRNATLTQSYGPESRGGACSAELIVSDGAILYPHLIYPDVLVAMSQPAYEMYKGKLSPEGLLIVDAKTIEVSSPQEGVLCGGGKTGVYRAEICAKRLLLSIPENPLIERGEINTKNLGCWSTELESFEALELPSTHP